MNRVFKFSILFLVLLSGFGHAQMQNIQGAYLIENYPPKLYKANPQIFFISQDNRGVMYFANNAGVVQFDGINWELIPIKGKADIKVRFVAVGPHGKIHVGADGEFGVLEPDSKGKMEFKSLVDSLKMGESFGEVKQIAWYKDDLYVRAEKKLFIKRQNGQLDVIIGESEMSGLYFVKNKTYVVLDGNGLFEIVEGKLKPAFEGYVFSNKQVKLIANINNRVIVVCENGLYEIAYNGDIKELEQFKETIVLSAIYVEGKYLALGSFSNGVILLDNDLKEIRRFGLEDGLNDPQVKSLFFDREQNLWIGSNVGISKIELETPISWFNKKKGIKSVIEHLTEYKKSLYMCSQDGIYFFENNKIKKHDAIQKDCYGIRSFVFDTDTLLFVAEVNSILAQNKGGNFDTLAFGGPYDFIQSPLNKNEILVLHYNGLSVLTYKQGKFIEGMTRRDFPQGEPFNFLVYPDGTLWIGTIDTEGKGGAYKTHVNAVKDTTISFNLYYTDKGLPSFGATYLFTFEEDLFACTHAGIYRYNDVHDNFEVYNGFGINFSGDKRIGVHRAMVDSKGRVWMMLFDEAEDYDIGYSERVADHFVWKSKEFNRYESEILHAFYEDKKGIIWMGGTDGLFRYDPNKKIEKKPPFYTLIRSINYGDSLIFGGAFPGQEDFLLQSESFVLQLAYSANAALTFNFSAASFIDEKNTLYSFKLEGLDDNWSTWDKRTMKEYNLSEGMYSFMVKSKNIYEDESEVVSFKFIVLPPWYRTVWAYILYVVLFVVVVIISINLSIRRVRQQNIKLEALVDERTIEVVAQKAEAEKQRDIAEHQKELVEEKNKEILDSISYAKRLQQAILPPDKLMNEVLPENFVLYQPKDIVAGDFYWMEHIKREGVNKVLFAAADCTGHGVPGAMVSVVCSNALDRTVKEFGITNPGKVLDKVTDLVIGTFEKSEDEVKDGMDIALCALTQLNEGEFVAQLEYAGANNPIWIVSTADQIEGLIAEPNCSENGVNMFEIKATKQPVGQFSERKAFETHILKLRKDDVFYLFSDGFADQFGGDKGKKYKYKPFKRFLLNHCQKDLNTQKKILADEFASWRGAFEQVDDVCVMAVRV